MNEIVKKNLLTGYKFMPEIYLNKPTSTKLIVLVDHLLKI